MGEFSGGLHGRKTPRPGGALRRAPLRAVVVGFVVAAAAMAMAAVERAAAAPTLEVAAHDAATGGVSAKLHGEAAGAGWTETDTGDAGAKLGAKLEVDALDANSTHHHGADIGGSGGCRFENLPPCAPQHYRARGGTATCARRCSASV